jgi:hypothetical protein
VAEDGSRNPCGSARKLIWIIHPLFFHPAELLKDLDNLVCCGHGREEILVLDDQEDPNPTVDQSELE